MYQVLYANLNDRYIINELPFVELSWSRVVNACGSASIKVPLDAGNLRIGKEIKPGRTAIYILRDGNFVWEGIAWTWDADLGNNTFNMNCEGIWSYFKHRYRGYYTAEHLGSVYTAKQRFQNRIAMDQVIECLWESADGRWSTQIPPDHPAEDETGALARGYYGDFRGLLQFKQGKDYAHDEWNWGMKRDRRYWAYEHKQVAETVEQLAELRGNVVNPNDDGFDILFETRWANERDDWDWDPSFPPKPVTIMRFGNPNGNKNGVILEHGRTAQIEACTADATNLVDFATTTGAGEGNEMLVDSLSIDKDGNEHFNEPIPQGMTALETVESYTDVTEDDTLRDKCRNTSRLGSVPIVIPTVSLIDGGPVDPTMVNVGDLVVVRWNPGFFNINDWYKVTQMDVSVADGEECKLTLANAEVF
ncbi:hypothetical protein O1L55_20755 [Streptomyces albulus]|nr:hypothetical protein [Streptomyces noursei]